MKYTQSSSSQPLLETQPLSTRQYLGLFVIFFLPGINLILIPKWAFSKKGNINRRHYARACLVVYEFGILIELMVFIYMTTQSGH